MHRVLAVALGLVILTSAASATSNVPDSLQISCDVDRTAFRKLAAAEVTVTFRLWDAVSGGSQCGMDHVVPMVDVLALRPKGDKFDGQRPRKFLELRAVLGTDGASGAPVHLCSGDESWLDVQVGATTLTCEFSADPNSKQNIAPDAPARRRLPAALYAQRCGTCTSTVDVSARVYSSGPFSTNSSVGAPVPFDAVRWDTSAIYSAGDPTKLCAPATGKYFIFGHAGWEANAAGLRSIGIRLNGTTYVAVANMPGSAIEAANDQDVVTHYALNAGDCVELVAFQTSGTGLDLRADPNISPEFGMVRLP